MSATTTKEVLDEFARVLGTDKKQGRVTLIGSATEVPDEGDDIVEKGAFKETLLKRKPKIILGHDWKQKVARVVSIREYMPGDPELKRLLDSAEHKVAGWPEEAGALVAEVQFNFDTQRGRDAFADVLFYEDEGEWSIGYRVRDSYRKKGIRHITRLDLYEISFVLHGMNRWSKTLSVKDVFGASAPASTDRGFGQTASLPRIGVRKRDKGWSLVRTETDTDLRFFDTEEEAYEALRRMSKKGTAFLPSERMAMAERKIALPDGSMPIITTKDLLTGIKVADMLRDEEVRQHVLDRATVMGRKSLVDFTLEVKKDYSEAEREAFADKGWALPDGSFPIADREDLKNAISLAHLGSDPAKAWAHIKKRAAALGATDLLPEGKAAMLSNTENAVTDDRTVLVDDVGTPEGQAPKPDDCGCDNCPEDCTCEDCPVKDAAETKAGGADRNRGNAEHLRKYWTRGAGAAKIRWGVKNDFYRCVALVSKHMTTTRAKGYCANRHKDATGHWPGKGPHAGKSADGPNLPEHLVIPSTTDYSAEDMEAIIEVAQMMDPTEHPPEIDMDEISLGAKGMDPDMVAAMAVNAFRDLTDDPDDRDIEIVRDGIKTLAETLGDDHELHLATGLFPEENAAFAANSVKSVNPDLHDDAVDSVREAIHLLSDAFEAAMYGEEYKHAGPWTEEYQPGKHTGPDKPGFKRKKRKPKKPDAPSIKPSSSSSKPKSKPKKDTPSKPESKPKSKGSVKQRAAALPAMNPDDEDDKVLKTRKTTYEQARQRALDKAEAGKDAEAEANITQAEGLLRQLQPKATEVDAPEPEVDAPEPDAPEAPEADLPEMSENDAYDKIWSAGDDFPEFLERLDMDGPEAARSFPKEMGELWSMADDDPEVGRAMTRIFGERGDTPEVDEGDDALSRIRAEADERGLSSFRDALDLDPDAAGEDHVDDMDAMWVASAKDPALRSAMIEVFGDPSDALETDETTAPERLRQAADTSDQPEGWFKDLPFYENYVGALGTEKATAYATSMPDEHKKAVDIYTGERYRPINRALRKGDPLSPPEENEKVAQRIDEAIANAPATTKKGTVYRGLSGSGDFIASLEPGAVIEDEGFGSTSADEGMVSKHFASGLSGDEMYDDYGIMLNITVPEGSKVLPVSPLSQISNEQEILLPRGSKYRVTGKRKTDAGGYIVDVELVKE